MRVISNFTHNTIGFIVLQVTDKDSKDVDFIIFHEPTTFDIMGYIEITDEFIQSTKVLHCSVKIFNYDNCTVYIFWQFGPQLKSTICSAQCKK